MVRGSAGRFRYYSVGHALQQADDRQRIWRRSKVWFAWSRHAALDRGKSGRDLPAPNRGFPPDPFLARHESVDPERFPLATPAVTEASGWLQPQRTDFGKRRAEESVLRSPEILSRVGSASRFGQ